MSQSNLGKGDPVVGVYFVAEALRYLARVLPENEGGLSCILRALGKEAESCASALDNASLKKLTLDESP